MFGGKKAAERQKYLTKLKALYFRKNTLLRECDINKVELNKLRNQLADLQSKNDAGTTDIIFTKISINKRIESDNKIYNEIANVQRQIDAVEERCRILGVDTSSLEM